MPFESSSCPNFDFKKAIIYSLGNIFSSGIILITCSEIAKPSHAFGTLDTIPVLPLLVTNIQPSLTCN